MSTRQDQKSDQELQQDVLDELNRDSHLKPAEVGVEVDDGVVILTGVVSCASKVEAATAAALSARGVTDIANELAVATAGQPRNDTQLAHAVRHALRWNPLLNGDQIDCVVRHGAVTLRGTVDAWDQRTWAETTVASVAGVKSVINEIGSVAPPTDANLQEEIEACISRRLPRGADVEVTVQAGVVTLRGHIGSVALRDTAEMLAARTKCVRQVVNHLATT